MSELETRIQSVFRKIFSDDELEIKREWTAANVTGWDSLNHIRLMVSLQKEFSIKFQTSEFVKIKNVGELIDTIQSKATPA